MQYIDFIIKANGINSSKTAMIAMDVRVQATAVTWALAVDMLRVKVS